MAFVYRAPKTTFTQPDQNPDVGPGLYVSQDFLNKKIIANKVPFQTSVFRDMKLKKDNSGVGPGSYYKDDVHENFLKMINKDNEKKKNPLYRSIDIDKQTPFGFYLSEDVRQKKGFLSKDRRFRNQSMDESPGPGSYCTDLSTLKANKSPNSLSRIKPGKNIVDEQIENLFGSPKRITSIPDKLHSYGYEIKGETVKMNDNPASNKIVTGTKNDSVGPGHYDVVSPNTWLKKNGTQWSKYKGARSQTLTTAAARSTAANSNIEDFEYSNEKRIKEELLLEKRKLEKAKLQKLFKEQGRRRRSLTNELYGSPNTSLLEKLAKQDSPGPGYYIDIYEHSAFKRDPIPEKLQKFGSGSQRFIPDHVTIENSVGPGSYFQEDIKSKKIKELNTRVNKSPPFMTSAKRGEFMKEDNLSPGPASYNPIINMTNKAVSSKCFFGSSEIRLPDRNKDINPGPGSYIPLKKWDKMTTADLIKMMKPKFQEVPKINEEKEKHEVPPVGSYNADLIDSINYRVEKKNSKFNSVNAPFMSVNKRFKYKSHNSNLGPGSYNVEKDLSKLNHKEFHPGFNSSDDRLKTEKAQTVNGPGLYNVDSYFNWNKKSYNILYYS